MAVYKETQPLAPAIRWAFSLLIAGVLGFSIASTVISGSEGTLPGLLIALPAGLLAMALLLSLRLELRFTESGMEYRLFPLERKQREIAWAEVASITIRPAKLFDGYGGFGRRRRIIRREMAYILNRGPRLIIHLKDGRTRTFTPASPQKAERFLRASNEASMLLTGQGQ